MTAEQIREYEYCKEYQKSLVEWKKNLNVPRQRFGCSTGCTKIELELEKLHEEMHNDLQKILEVQLTVIKERIERI